MGKAMLRLSHQRRGIRMKTSHFAVLFLSLLVICLVTVGIIGASLEASEAASSFTTVLDRRHNDDKFSADCVQVSNLDGMNGQWFRQQGLYNGHAFYYNAENDRYLLMTRPNVHRPTEMYYAVHQGPLEKESTSVMLGYCAEPYLHILDCNGRWRSDFRYHESARFEVCQRT